MKSYFLFFALLLVLQIHAQSEMSAEIAKEIKEIEENILPMTIVEGQKPLKSTIISLMEEYKVPGISVAVATGGKLRWAKGYGLADTKEGTKVDAYTLFQAGSISKPLAALAALHLVQLGKIELDEDVNTYLKTWKIADSEFIRNEKVTLRRILTHTAGITVHGFPGYPNTSDFPTLVNVLNGQGNTDPILVDEEPGCSWRYSGGGYTIMEKLVEDVSGLPLEVYMERNIFPKLGMTQSTFYQPLLEEYHQNASAAYNRKGKMIKGKWHNYPERAAAGLWTTPSELIKYCLEIQEISSGKEGGVLSTEMVKKMLEPHEGNWGLGPSIKGDGASLTFGHGGKNAGFTNNMIAHVNKGNAIIIMTSGDNGNNIIRPLQNTISSYYNMDISKPREIELFDMDEEELKRFVGTYIYKDEKDYKAKVRVKDGQLIFKIGGKHTLTPIGPLKFYDIDEPQQIDFLENENGEIISFNLNPSVKFIKTKKE